MSSLQTLQKFRNRCYRLLGNGRDALFDLMDAVLTTRSVSSFVELSTSPVFRRKWPSIYAALQDAFPPRQALLQEYAEHISALCDLIVLAGDHTAWSRLHAVTLRERTYEHQPSSMPTAKPITIGHGYSTITWIPESSGSWALALLHERITSFENPLRKAATQLRQICQQLSGHILFLGDGEYGSAPFLKYTADLTCSKLLRLRPNRVLYRAPGPYTGRGRPTKHGDKFKLKAPDTWGEAQTDLVVPDLKLGRLRLRRWDTLHLKQAAAHPFSLLLVERLDAQHAKPLWLLWIGQDELELEQLWKLYLRRFAIEHWYRFVRQRLHWTLPQLGTPEQMETWSDLMPLLSWQLWLARDVVKDDPLPWQKSATQLSPGRVANAFTPVLVRIGSPAPDPKPRGKSPGWPPGKSRTRKKRYPTVKKRYTKPKQAAMAAA